MNTKTLGLMAAGALALLAISPAKATQITGQITMNGSATLDSTSLASATQVSSATGVIVVPTESGAFGSIPNATPVTTFNGFAFSGGSASPLWSLTYNGWTYSFSLTSDYIMTQNANFLNVVGSGTLSITGAGSPYTTTPGTWTFTLSDTTGGNAGSFQFGFNSTTGAVPDGGLTVAMLGMSLIGLSAVRSRIGKKA